MLRISLVRCVFVRFVVTQSIYYNVVAVALPADIGICDKHEPADTKHNFRRQAGVANDVRRAANTTHTALMWCGVDVYVVAVNCLLALS